MSKELSYHKLLSKTVFGTPDEIQQALNVANKIWGSKDAHIVKGIKGHSITKIVLTDTFGTIRSYPLNEYGKRIYAD